MNTSFFCDLDALTDEQRQRHRELAAKLRPTVIEFRELPDGYAARISSSGILEAEIKEFLVLEKLCCPFFTLTLQVVTDSRNAEQATYNVNITGPGDIKPFIRAEFGIPGASAAS